MTSLPANELILLLATWSEGRFLSGNAWCEVGLVFVPEHGKSYLLTFTGPSDPASTSRRLSCGVELFEPSERAVPWVPWPGQFGNRQEVCAVGKRALEEAATYRQERVRLAAEAAAARASAEAAARAARTASSLPKAR